LAWLLRDGEVLAAAELLTGRRQRARGLLGRETLDGAVVLRPCRQVHTVGMRFPIDVAFCDRDGVVLRTDFLRPWRVSALVFRSVFVIEASAGAFERWRLEPGDRLELRS